MKGIYLTAAVLASCICVGTARAQVGEIRQNSNADRFERSLEQIRRDTILGVNDAIPIDQRLTLEMGGYVTFSYLSMDDNNDDNHGLRQTEAIGYLRLNLDNAQEFYLRYRTGWRDFNPGDSFDGRGDEAIDGQIDTGYYKFDLAAAEAAYKGRTIKNNLVVKVGSDLVYWGNGMTIAQVIAGGMVDITWNELTLSLIAGVTPVRTVDFDSSRPNFDYNTHRGFYGAMLAAQMGQHRPFIFGLVQRDYNHPVEYDFGPVVTKFDYNSYYLGMGINGTFGDHWVYGIEAVYEGGRSLSNSFTTNDGQSLPTPVEQVHNDIQAWAADFKIEYLVSDVRNTKYGAEVILASADGDRESTSNTFNGNKPGTDDNAFNGFGLLNTGLAFAPTVSNMMAFRVGGSTVPFPESGPLRRLQLGSDFFIFNKLQSDAGIDEATKDATFLGVEPDIYLNWQMTSDLTFAVRYGVFFPSSDAFQKTEPRQFLYLSISYAF